MNNDYDYGGLAPDIDETYAYLGATLIACAALLASITASIVLAAWMIIR